VSLFAEFFSPVVWRDWFNAGVNQLGYATFWFAVAQIIFINVLLSGDNAIVIAMACRGLPQQQRRWGLIVGAGLAVLLRIIFTVVLASLLTLPYLKLIGGAALLYISAKLLVPEGPDKSDIEAAAHLWRAVLLIVIADIVMSFDNVVAIAAAARGDFFLLAIGLAISIPLLVVGAALVAVLLDRFPVLIWAGAALLGWIGGQAMATDPVFSARFAALGGTVARQVEFAASVSGAALAIAAGGLWQRWRQSHARSSTPRNDGPFALFVAKFFQMWARRR
jgi:YjbE family integral membrane protein